jgi:hypothetical protein
MAVVGRVLPNRPNQSQQDAERAHVSHPEVLYEPHRLASLPPSDIAIFLI